MCEFYSSARDYLHTAGPSFLEGHQENSAQSASVWQSSQVAFALLRARTPRLPGADGIQRDRAATTELSFAVRRGAHLGADEHDGRAVEGVRAALILAEIVNGNIRSPRIPAGLRVMRLVGSATTAPSALLERSSVTHP